MTRASALHSDSAVDLDTMFCFFDDQETRFGLRKTLYPPTSLLSSRLDNQSASEMAAR